MAKSALFTVRKNEPCPQCGAELVIRSGKHGPFLGCSHYPECDYVRPLKSQADGHIVKILEGQDCPVCGAVLVLRQGRFGMFIGCSHYPECEHTEQIDKPDETAITCPQCQTGHWSSDGRDLAKPSIPAIVIPIASSLSISNRWRGVSNMPLPATD
jgi:putative DNA topoisomerase